LERDPVFIVQEAGWASGQVCTGAENLASTGIRSPDRPARSESLVRCTYSIHGCPSVHDPNHRTRMLLLNCYWTGFQFQFVFVLSVILGTSVLRFERIWPVMWTGLSARTECPTSCGHISKYFSNNFPLRYQFISFCTSSNFRFFFRFFYIIFSYLFALPSRDRRSFPVRQDSIFDSFVGSRSEIEKLDVISPLAIGFE
jgi:hypothetical protein